MHPLFESNLRNSLNVLANENLHFGLDRPGWHPFPAFSRTEDEINCPQMSFFGYYALRLALRGILLGVNFLSAGEAIRRKRSFGPIVLLFYTSAYHSLQCFLSFNGRVPFDEKEYSKIEGSASIGSIVAILTESNDWRFEKIKRNHVDRWNQLKSIFASDESYIPECFHQLFQDFLIDREKNPMPLIERLKRRAEGKTIEPGIRYKTHELMEEFLREIIHSRHHAMYDSFGSDPGVYQAIDK